MDRSFHSFDVGVVWCLNIEFSTANPFQSRLDPPCGYVRLSQMNDYDSPMFRMACRQFDLAPDHLGIEPDRRARVCLPKGAMIVACPTRMDDGSTRVFMGYRVQHHLTLGPTKGGLRYNPEVTLGEV